MTAAANQRTDSPGTGNVEPSRNTRTELLDVQEELIGLEPLFHRPEHGTSRETFEAMTDEDFWETGASGQRYNREFVIDTVLRRYASDDKDLWETEDFYCQEIAANLYLLTYTLHQGPRVTRRTTLWRKLEERWAAVFHQGTIVE